MRIEAARSGGQFETLRARSLHRPTDRNFPSPPSLQPPLPTGEIREKGVFPENAHCHDAGFSPLLRACGRLAPGCER